ncbi:helix-turn-helix transcriptional regulator [uncultured Bifidobacterium sp.]|uniref:helix-turn-helix domain-containing protein n=1 Tax=uncultured Bifidobacterium sp. TaxID=165187 RepID=UPI00260DB7BB|nr:helix-turn-helix transcriptional regulator [uncultured Bifidobacterium sp.]
MAQQLFTDEQWADYATLFGRNLQRLRNQKGISQERIAHDAGMSRSQYQRLESGANRDGQPSNPGLRNLISLAEVLDVTLDDLAPRTWPDTRAI